MSLALRSQVIVTADISKTITLLENLTQDEKIIKIIEEEKSFSVADAQLAIEKAYMASEETTIILLAAKIFSPIVQNKLLKVIEEPPKNKEFILVTNSKASILATIRSRLPIQIQDAQNEEKEIGLDIRQLSLALVYDFIQTHKRTQAKEMATIVEYLSKEAMASGAYDLDSKTLTLFSDCYVALDMGSPPTFVLNTLLLKLLARKKR